MIEQAIVGTRGRLRGAGQRCRALRRRSGSDHAAARHLSHSSGGTSRSRAPRTRSSPFPRTCPTAKRDEIRTTAKAIYTALGCKGLARVDMFLQDDGRIVLNEVNTLPGFTSYSRYPRMMAAAGVESFRADRPAHLVGDGAMNMETGIRLPGRGAARGSLGRQVRDLGQLHRHAGRRIRSQPHRGFARPGRGAAGRDRLARLPRRLRLAALGRLPPAARGESLPGMVGPAGGRTHEGAVLSEHRPGRDVHERVRRAEVGPQPGERRRPHALPPGHRRARRDGRRPRLHGRAFPSRGKRSVGHRSRRIAGACVPSWNTAGSNAYEREWWHYALRDEPYPDTYFDFPIL